MSSSGKSGSSGGKTPPRAGKARTRDQGRTNPAPRRKSARRRKPRARHLLIRLLLWAGWLILRPLVRLWRPVRWLLWRGAFVFGLFLALWFGYVFLNLPPLGQMIDQRARGSVTLLDRHGAVFAWRGEQFGGMITAETVSPHLRNAVIATEDQRFYRHFGISPRGIASAIVINLREGRGPLSGHGGSTITQQTAKLLCLGVPYVPSEWSSEAAYEADCRKGSLWRKAREAVYALALEAKFTKDEILTIYLNRAFLGAGARGFEAASRRYFGVSANAVSPAQAAMLAGLLVAPSRYAPTNDLGRAQDRAATVLRLMAEQGYLSAAGAAAAQDNPAGLSQAAAARAGGYFADWVMGRGPDFLTRDTTEDVILRTTLDQRIQTAAEDAMRHVFETKVREGSKAQAAIVVMSADGAVRAMVGGRNTRAVGAFNRATQAQRQTGSTFKPFVYAAALDLGHGADDLVDASPLTLDVPGSGLWTPENYRDEVVRGAVTLTEALGRSLNTAAVRVSEAVGRDAVRAVAADFGIGSDLADGPALALGASEATLIEMTGAYAGILNGGSSVTPYGLVELRLQGDREPLMKQGGGIGERVISGAAARQLTYMMSRVVEDGTGGRARLPDGRQAAGKTGTTQAARDAWFIGFTADYVAGVWMGYDDNTPLRGVTGGGLPADIWRETMVRVHEGTGVRPLPMAAPEPGQVFGRAAQPGGARGGGAGRTVGADRTGGIGGAIETLLLELFGVNRGE